MQHIRRPAVAGSWYPGSADALAEAVDGYLAHADAAAADFEELQDLTALVAPHAGLMYSGPVAAYAYRQLRGRTPGVIVLVGPSHFVGFDGVSIYAHGGFASPLGVSEIDEACAAALLAATPVIREHQGAHAREHSLEMQLPFIARLAPGVKIVPLVMGYQTPSTARALGEALAAVLPGRNALLVASSDLSHYQSAAVASELDSVVIDYVERFDPDGLQRTLNSNPEHACGGGPMVSVMHAARALGATDAAVLKYADSGDVSGDKTAVVGYLAAAFGRRAHGHSGAH